MSDSDLSRRSSDNEPDSQQLDESEEGEDNARTPSPRGQLRIHYMVQCRKITVNMHVGVSKI